MKVKNLLDARSYVINLEKDKDRLNRFYSSFDSFNLKHPTRLIAVDANHPKNKAIVSKILNNGHTYIEYPTEAGCALSHWSILSKALRENWEWVVIFEDDVVLSPFTPKLLERDIPDDWEFLYLGHCPNHSERNPASICPPYSHKPSKGWYSFTSHKDAAFGMYAYAIRGSILQRILESYSFHCPLDYHILKNHTSFKVYGLYPCLVIHDYHYGSYSNPKRKEIYPPGTSIEIGSPFIYTAMGTSLLGAKHIAFSYASIFLIITAWIYGRFYIRKMEHFKRIHPNFPGIYGIDSYAPFCDVWTPSMRKELEEELREVSKRSDVFLWGHTLLGAVRDGTYIPWETHLCMAHSKATPPPNTKYIKWTPYTNRDGHIHIDSHTYPYLMFKKTSILGTPLRYPDTYKEILSNRYGPDCLSTIHSPSHIDIGYMGIMGRWKVPERYRCSIKLSDLNGEL